MKAGAIIYCEDEGRTSWWFVINRQGDSIMLERTGNDWSPSFDGEFTNTYWDEKVMREQHARYVNDADVPDRIWASLAKWRLIGADPA